jgi:small subunit ribosomal protein S16
MAVKLRLMRIGKKKQPSYRVVVMDERAPRDGRYIEQIGRYDPRQKPSLVEIDNERAADWLSKGAQPTETVEKLLNVSGALNTMKVRSGEIHVVGVEKPKKTEEAAPASEPQADSEPEAAAEAEADGEPEPAAEPEADSDDSEEE